MKMRFLIVDDEPLAQRVIEKYAADIPYLEQLGKCESAFEAMDFLYNNEVDLLFLDINMPKMSGLDFLKLLKNPPVIIVTTAYREYALESYELDVIDYLKKPFSFERFFRAIQKAQEKLKAEPTIIEKKSTSENETTNEYIFLKADNKIHKVNFKDIYFIEALGDYIKIHLKDKHIVNYSTLKGIEKTLPKNSFCRVHKSYIVAIDKLETIEGNTITICDNLIPIGKSFRKSFFDLIK